VGRALVVAFGNVYRRDDGVGWAVLNALHERLYGKPLPFDEDGFDRLGRDVDLVFLHQLVPDLAETLAQYGLVVFVDAHVQGLPVDVYEQGVEPEYRPGLVTHHVNPSSLLAITRDLYGATPRCVVISVLGHDFDFGEGLSPRTAEQVPCVVERILDLVAQGPESATR